MKIIFTQDDKENDMIALGSLMAAIGIALESKPAAGRLFLCRWEYLLEKIYEDSKKPGGVKFEYDLPSLGESQAWWESIFKS